MHSGPTCTRVKRRVKSLVYLKMRNEITFLWLGQHHPVYCTVKSPCKRFHVTVSIPSYLSVDWQTTIALFALVGGWVFATKKALIDDAPIVHQYWLHVLWGVTSTPGHHSQDHNFNFRPAIGGPISPLFVVPHTRWYGWYGWLVGWYGWYGQLLYFLPDSHFGFPACPAPAPRPPVPSQQVGAISGSTSNTWSLHCQAQATLRYATMLVAYLHSMVYADLCSLHTYTIHLAIHRNTQNVHCLCFQEYKLLTNLQEHTCSRHITRVRIKFFNGTSVAILLPCCMIVCSSFSAQTLIDNQKAWDFLVPADSIFGVENLWRWKPTQCLSSSVTHSHWTNVCNIYCSCWTLLIFFQTFAHLTLQLIEFLLYSSTSLV